MLKGARILVTRPAHQAGTLSRLIEEQGGIAVRFPTLAIVPSDESEVIKDTLTHLDQYQWVIFTSVNAVNYALNANDGKIDCISSVRFAAVGQSTANAMKIAGLAVDLLPEHGYNSEALLAMPQLQQVEKQKHLIVRGEGGREHLATTLRSRGAEVNYLEVYKRAIPCVDSTSVVKLLTQDRLDVITITSVEALQNLIIMLGEKNNKLLLLMPLVVVSDRIRCIAAGFGFNRIAVSDNPTDTAILETVITCITGEQGDRVE